MKIPLNVRWHYELNIKKVYTGNIPRDVEDIPVFCYKLIKGDDVFHHEDIAIKSSKLLKFIKKLPLTSDFDKSIPQDKDNEIIQIMQVEPEESIYIKLKYDTINYKVYLDVVLLKKGKDDYELIIRKHYFYNNSHKVTKRAKTKHLSKSEAIDMLSQLPETIDLGIFTLPFGNCLECKIANN